jgi:hypothetical protein
LDQRGVQYWDFMKMRMSILGAVKAGNLLTSSLSYHILRHSASRLGGNLVNYDISTLLSVMGEWENNGCFLVITEKLNVPKRSHFIH